MKDDSIIGLCILGVVFGLPILTCCIVVIIQTIRGDKECDCQKEEEDDSII